MVDIKTNEKALRTIASTIRGYNDAQLNAIGNYFREISSIECDWDDSTYSALREAVELQYMKIIHLIEQTRDFPPYLEKKADAIRENKMLGRGGVL